MFQNCDYAKNRHKWGKNTTIIDHVVGEAYAHFKINLFMLSQI
jgi:hypothetical protein